MQNIVLPQTVARIATSLSMFFLAFLVSMPVMAESQLSAADEFGRYRFKVEFDQPGLLERNPELRSASGIAKDSPAFERAMGEVQVFQSGQIDAIGAEIGRAADVSHYFVLAENAIGLRLTEAEARRVAQLPDVVSVTREQVYSLDTYRGPEFINAHLIWNGSATPSNIAYEGEGMIAGVLDTGFNSDHPSFANDPSCGHGVGSVPPKILGAVDCSSTNPGGFCNGPSAEDTNGHGSHTASTVAGNRIDATANPPPNIPAPFTEMSGVAPCAHLRIYKTCPGSTCPGFDINAGLQSALIDGDIDVINYSISGGASPWNDNDRTKLDLVAGGTFVAASAGNTSTNVPNPVGQVNHRGPWVMSIAASTRDGDFSGEGSISGPGTPPPLTTNVTMDRGSDSPLGSPFTNKPIRRDPGQTAGAEGCSPPTGTPFPAGVFNNAVALVQRGGCAFSEKITNAAAAGAEMVVVWNNVAGGFGMSTPGQANIPAYSIPQDEGQAMADFIDANPATATFDFNLIPSQGDVLANFSFRGPTPAPLQHLQKPDITAPGVNILAAFNNGPEYGTISGTSMSGPHVAGAAILVRQAQPSWSPAEVKSALQMTASKAGFREDGSTPWDWDDVGSGRADLAGAALAGLVMNETFANFLAANPANAGDVRTLNLAAVRNVDCTPDCNWTRTVTAGQDFATDWTVSANGNGFNVQVSPTSFSLAEREVLFRDQLETGSTEPARSSQQIQITASSVPVGAIRFGEVNFVEDGSLAPDAHITVAVQD